MSGAKGDEYFFINITGIQVNKKNYLTTKRKGRIILIGFMLCTFFMLPLSTFGQTSLSIQDSLQLTSFYPKPDTIEHPSTKLERVAYVIGGSVTFSLLDFLGFNLTESHPGARLGYRVIQVVSQTAISYFLYKKFGLTSAISFNLIWWTWGDDLGFYGWTNLVNPAAPWFNRDFNGLHGNGVSWAGWTPIGLLRRQGTIIDKYTLFSQALVGLSISIIIL